MLRQQRIEGLCRLVSIFALDEGTSMGKTGKVNVFRYSDSPPRARLGLATALASRNPSGLPTLSRGPQALQDLRLTESAASRGRWAQGRARHAVGLTHSASDLVAVARKVAAAGQVAVAGESRLRLDGNTRKERVPV